MKPDGKFALVTGGANGIGRGCAIALAKAGANVAINDRTRTKEADETVADIQALGRRLPVKRQGTCSLHGNLICLGNFSAAAILRGQSSGARGAFLPAQQFRGMAFESDPATFVAVYETTAQVPRKLQVVSTSAEHSSVANT